MITSFVIVFGFAILSVVMSWVYFRRFSMMRPPFGVIDLRDVTVAMVGLILIPYLYLSLPLWLVTVILGVITVAALNATLEPMLVSAHRWLICLPLVAVDVGLGLTVGITDEVFLLFNNAIMVMLVVGVSNMWAQYGMRAAHATVFAGVLAIYDLVATWKSTLMLDLFIQLTKLPLFPLMASGLAEVRTTVGVGLGDLLMASLFPLVMRKAYGRLAGVIALVSGIFVIGLVLVLLLWGTMGSTIPVMVFLGPLFVAQYLYWRLTCGGERTTWQYVQIEPLPLRNRKELLQERR